jgi:hypothetical protein
MRKKLVHLLITTEQVLKKELLEFQQRHIDPTSASLDSTSAPLDPTCAAIDPACAALKAIWFTKNLLVFGPGVDEICFWLLVQCVYAYM